MSMKDTQMTRAWADTWGHVVVRGAGCCRGHIDLSILHGHPGPWWHLSPSCCFGHVWVHDPAAARVCVNVRCCLTAGDHASVEPCVEVKGQWWTGPTLHWPWESPLHKRADLTLTSPGIADPDGPNLLSLSLTAELTPTLENPAQPLTTVMGEMAPSFTRKGWSAQPRLTNSVLTQRLFQDLELFLPNIYPITCWVT